MTTFSQQILSDNPIAFLRFNAPVGSAKAADISGNGHDGTLAGGCTLGGPSLLLGDPFGGTITTDGSTGYVALDAGLTLAGVSYITLQLFFTLKALPTGNGRLLANSHTDADHKGFQFVINSGGTTGFFDIGDGTSEDYNGFTYTFVAGAKYMIVATVTPSNLITYVARLDQGTVTSLTTLSTTAHLVGNLAASGFPINIGRNPAYNGDYAALTLDDLAIYTSSVPTSRLIAHAAAASSLPTVAAPAINPKQQIVKVYNQAGQYIDIWRDAPLLGFDAQSQGPKFAVNNITSQITVTLPRRFDSFDEGGDSRGRGTITAGNIVNFLVYDNNTLTSGRLVFSGYIDGYIPQIALDGTESVQVLITPWDVVLGDVKYIGTQNFGTAGLTSSYEDTVGMFNWAFAPLIAASSATAVTAGVTTALTLTRTNNIVQGQTLYLRGTGADSAKTNGPLTVASVVGSVVTFTAAIPTNSYSHTIIVCGVAPITSATVITGGLSNGIVVSSITGLYVNMTVGIVGTGSEAGQFELATITIISGGNFLVFASPLQYSYNNGVGVCTPLSFNSVLNQPYAYPLTLDGTNPATSGSVYATQLHNQSFADFFETVRTLSPANWFWRVNSDKSVTFTIAPTTAKHTFIIGKHISQPQYQKNFSNLKNYVYVKATGTSASATGSDVTTYGHRTLVIVEPRLVDAATTQRFANSTLAQVDRVDYRSVLTIVDNRGDLSGYGYDIETIKVGDTCRIENPGYNALNTLWDASIWDSDSWDFPPTSFINQVVVVTALTYKFDSVDVELSSLQPSQDKFLIDLARKFENNQFN